MARSQPNSETRCSFVVITSQRTGSTLLVKSLDSSPRIFCAGELFHPGMRTLHKEFQFPFLQDDTGVVSRMISTWHLSSRVREHLGYFYSQAGPEAQAVGFKLMVSQAAAYPAIVPCLSKLGVTALFLYRRNAFDTALSYFKATVTGRFHSDGQSPTGEAVGVIVSEREFRRRFDSCQHDRNRVFKMQKSYGGRLLAYEDLVAHWDASIALVGQEIGMPELRVTKVLEKLADNGGIEIENEELLRRRFVDRQFES